MILIPSGGVPNSSNVFFYDATSQDSDATGRISVSAAGFTRVIKLINILLLKMIDSRRRYYLTY